MKLNEKKTQIKSNALKLVMGDWLLLKYEKIRVYEKLKTLNKKKSQLMI